MHINIDLVCHPAFRNRFSYPHNTSNAKPKNEMYFIFSIPENSGIPYLNHIDVHRVITTINIYITFRNSKVEIIMTLTVKQFQRFALFQDGYIFV